MSVKILRPVAWSVLGVIVGVLASTARMSLWHVSSRPGRPTHGREMTEPSGQSASGLPVTSVQTDAIRTVPVILRPFRVEKEAVGRIAFNEDTLTPVFSPYAGRVVRILVRLGDTVTQGSPLLELDTPDLVGAESDLIAAASAVAKARAVLERARRTEERLHRLYLEKAVALKDWEQAQADVRTAESDLQAAEAAWAAARDRLRAFGKSEAEIERIERTHVIDRVARVRAPIAGSVVARKVGPGQYVRPDLSEPLLTIADLSTLWVWAEVYESDVPWIREGQPVEIRVLAYPSEVFQARIVHIGASVDPVTRRVPVRCVVPNPDRKLKPDMFATVLV